MVGRCINISSANKRASLSPTQRPRNGFCSTSGRRETRDPEAKRSAFGPSSRKGSDFDPDAVRVRVNVGLRGAHSKRLHPAKDSDPFENGMRQSLLEIVPPRRSKLFDLGAEKVVVPGTRRIVLLGDRKVLEPDLDRDQQKLRRPNLEIVESDVHLDREGIQQDTG